MRDLTFSHIILYPEVALVGVDSWLKVVKTKLLEINSNFYLSHQHMAAAVDLDSCPHFRKELKSDQERKEADSVDVIGHCYSSL